MIQPTLLFVTLLSTLCAGIYYYVGRVLARRRSSTADSRLAWRLFVAWWYALAAATLIGAILSFLGAIGIDDLALFTTLTLLSLLTTCIALYSLMFYLLYLFTGNRKLLGPLSVFYVVYYAMLVYNIQAHVPIRVAIERWRTSLVFQNPIQGPFFVLLLFLLVFPQIIGSFAYFMLYFRVTLASQKYRILLVSWSIIVWFLSAFLASITGISESDIWQVFSRLIGLIAASAILVAYQPPAWIKQRFGVRSVGEENS